MKKRTSRLIVIIIVVFTILLTLSLYCSKESTDLNFFEKSIKDTITYTQKVLYSPIKFVKDKISIYQEKQDLYEKYSKLKSEIKKTELYYAQIQELQKEVAELKSALELNATLSEYTYVNATVINRNMGEWYNILNIDKGLKNGVKKGDAVIISDGLIGKIIKVSNFSSTVKLLSTEEISNKISVKIKTDKEDLYGLLIGYNATKNVYEIEGITDLNNIREGDLVTTTGLTDYFPSGIIVARVLKIVKDEYDLSAVVEATPTVNFKNISIVTVLNRKAA